ncbi:heavy-metal-associated domain-containing protein [Longispora albida]|uniref:heavy-metal-associated domain-containing protein n=1 Tax=Longispora albida TaxID=203523 RepID=UPI00036DE64C|nr:heavy-metal-associated domain-containing protein [Longispora albida]
MVLTRYQVTGMTCGGCAGRVQAQLGGLPGVSEVTVDVASGQVSVRSAAELDRAAVAGAVTAAGYELAG